MTKTIFTIINIGESGTESNGSALPGIDAKNISTSTIATKIAKPLPGRRMLYIRMGDQGPTVKLNARLYSSAVPGHSEEHGPWAHNGTGGVFANTLLKVTTYGGLEELPASSYWWVDSKTITREGGYFGIYNMELTLTRSWFTVKDVARGS
jgi:hypothetical protein